MDVEEENFDISFSLDDAVAEHGDGVYTIMVWAENEENAFPVSINSIIVS
jgi:hypothetical protein